MKAAHARQLKSGKEYDRYFPKPIGKTIIVLENARTAHTIEAIKEVVATTLYQTEKIAPLLKRATTLETCYAIWKFIYDHIQYQEDKPNIEQIRVPSRLWSDRIGDCDCFTTFASSCLTNLRIPHSLEIASYNPNNKQDFTHIYISVPNGKNEIIIDCVADIYNYKYPTVHSEQIVMQLEILNGPPKNKYKGKHALGCAPNTPCGCNGQKPMNGFGDWIKEQADKAKDAIKDATQSVVGTFKNIREEIRDGVRVFIKEIDKGGGKIIRFVNRYTNPGTITVRNGILICCKIDLFNVSERVKWGYISKEQAMSKGLSADSWDTAKRGLDKLETMFYNMGGKKHNLKKAILNGKGNKGWGGTYIVPMDAATWNNDEFEDEQEYFLTLGTMLDPQTLGLLCWAINHSRWTPDSSGKTVQYTEIVNGKVKAADFDWWKVYDGLRSMIFEVRTDSYPVRPESRVYIRNNITGLPEEFLAFEPTAQNQLWSVYDSVSKQFRAMEVFPSMAAGVNTRAKLEARQKQILNDEKYLLDPFKGDIQFFAVVLGAMGIIMPNVLPAITDKNGNPMADTSSLAPTSGSGGSTGKPSPMQGLSGEPASTAIAIAAASGAIASIAATVANFKSPGCKAPSPPTKTGDASIDAISESTYQAQLVACAASQTAANVQATANVVKPPTGGTTTPPAAQLPAVPPSGGSGGSASVPPPAVYVPNVPAPTGGSEPDNTNNNDIPEASNTGAMVVGGLFLIGAAYAIFGGKKGSSTMGALPKSKTKSKKNGIKERTERMKNIVSEAKAMQKSGESWTSAISRASKKIHGSGSSKSKKPKKFRF